MSENSTITEIQQLLPFFVNGSLDDTEHRLVAAALEDSEALRDEVEVLRLIRAQMQTEDTAQSNGEMGLARLLREVGSEQAPNAANRTKPPMFRFSGLVAGVAAVMLAFVAGTTIPREVPLYIQASGADDSARLTVSFQPDITQKQMSEMLLSFGLIIVDGPSASGFYRVELFDDGDLQVVANALRSQSSVFEFVDTPQ